MWPVDNAHIMQCVEIKKQQIFFPEEVIHRAVLKKCVRFKEILTVYLNSLYSHKIDYQKVL